MKFIIALLAAALLSVAITVAQATNEVANDAEAVGNLRAKRGIDSAIAKICKKIEDRFGWYCDDPANTGLWKVLNLIRGVKDCNSFCIKIVSKKEGSCQSVRNNYKSSWCPAGTTCICN